jgi:hypothetical protein
MSKFYSIILSWKKELLSSGKQQLIPLRNLTAEKGTNVKMLRCFRMRKLHWNSAKSAGSLSGHFLGQSTISNSAEVCCHMDLSALRFFHTCRWDWTLRGLPSSPTTTLRRNIADLKFIMLSIAIYMRI